MIPNILSKQFYTVDKILILCLSISVAFGGTQWHTDSNKSERQDLLLSSDNTNSESYLNSILLKPGSDIGKDASFRTHHQLFGTNYGNSIALSNWVWTGNGKPDQFYSVIDFIDLKDYVSLSCDSAYLTLYSYPGYPITTANGGQYGNNELEIRLINQEWLEDEVIWSTQPSVTEEFKITLPQDNSYSHHKIDVTSLVNEYLSKPGTYHGFQIRLKTSQPYSSRVYVSSDYSDSSLHPDLRLFFKNPAAANPSFAIDNGDIFMSNACYGMVLKSPNGSCYRIKVDNSGNLMTEKITCPE